MQKRVRPLLWILCAMLAMSAAGQGIAHHGGGEPLAAADHVSDIVATANEACFVRGTNADALALWATSQHWEPATPEQLRAGNNTVATLIAGWTYDTRFSAFAVVQSRLNGPDEGYVCSVTTKLAFAEQHGEVKAAFQGKFGRAIVSEPERAESHKDHFWIERDAGQPVKITILHAPATQSLTIRMVHARVPQLRF